MDDMFLELSSEDMEWFSKNHGLVRFPALEQLDFKARPDVCELFFSGLEWTDRTAISVNVCSNVYESIDTVIPNIRKFLHTISHRLPYPIQCLGLFHDERLVNIYIDAENPGHESNAESLSIKLPPLDYPVLDVIQILPLHDLGRFNYWPVWSNRSLEEQVWTTLKENKRLRWIQVTGNQPSLLNLLESKVAQ